MPDSTGHRLFIERADLRRTRVAADPDAPASRPLEPGQVRLQVEHFALTSNNVTYAALGDEMKYWQFFPAGDPALVCLPVWGFATVIESQAEGVTMGRRVWGFLPAGTHLVVVAARVTAAGFSDAAPHRQGLAGVYNRYAFCDADPGWQPAMEGLQAVLRPLFTTAFLLDDFLADNRYFEARQVLLSSASSKTAYATAFCLAQRRGTPGAPTIVGLTSPRHADFARSLGCYDAVRLYDEIPALDASLPTVYVDVAGNAALRRSVHERLGPALVYSCAIGGTHGSDAGSGIALPGPRAVVFLAAPQAAKRSGPPPEGWGRSGLEQHIAKTWAAFTQRVSDDTAPWMTIVRADGGPSLQDSWLALLEGRTDAAAGLTFSLLDSIPPADGQDPEDKKRRPRSMPATDFITQAPRDLAAWVSLFDPAKLPVLASTADALDELRAIEDKVDAHMLSEAIASDPLMTLKVLAHLARLRRGREGSDTETVTAALVMLGIPPFFRAFETLDTVEDRLAEQPEAMAGFAEVLRRARRAARFAISFAVHRMDNDAPLIHEAALLHDFAELLLWLRAPTLVAEIARRQQADPALRSATAQKELLHIELVDLQHALAKAWNLPALLVEFTDDHARVTGPQLRSVQLAIRVARHSTLGWDNAALPDDIHDVSELLNLALEPTARLLREIDAD